ncbi:hypothetical protein ID871_32205 [Streptomyces pratensis]|nr:hypothetical protein [Streptomyces pratensis]
MGAVAGFQLIVRHLLRGLCPMNAPKTEVDAALQRRYDEALANGACGPK